ncbi:Phosphonate ABC transporter phosphate-binding periplasmic component (TC 3.A.1.9.1) [hydrothermal vent metagenome]|uniref:Phosphonate ABC transporter phosphate-binding periplasmic component (TC 3.A.1.9.1) n=1 Tax=hydrothermal vent metagenome TaxID=652676 RepID=A0A3B0XMQ7_9ZZZZ
MKYHCGVKCILLICLCMVNFQSAAKEQAIRFGSVAMDVPSVMHRRLTPLTRYLSEKLQLPVNLKLAKDMRGAIQDLSSDRVDLAYLTPVAYIRSNTLGNTQLIAKMRSNKKASFKLMIVVKENSPIQTVDDLVGHSFAFGDRAALLQRAVVVGAGMPLEKLGSYQFLKHYDNIVRAVLLGDYDAGILKDSKAFKWQNKGIRIIYSSPDLPPYNIAASGKISQQMLAKLKQVFLQLDIENPQHREVIQALGKKYDGFVMATDADYDIVRQLIKPFSD